MVRSTAGHQEANLLDVLAAQGYTIAPEERPAPLVGADGLPATAMGLAPSYEGEDRNAGPREEKLLDGSGWSHHAAAGALAFAAEQVTPYATDVPGTTEEASPASPSGPLTGSARTNRVEQIRSQLAALGHTPTPESTRPAEAHRNYIRLHSGV